MEKLYEELDDANEEIDKLKIECKAKTELSERLKRAHDEQFKKIRESSSKVEKLTQELYAKEDEILTIKQLSEDLKSSLKDKEATIKQISFANDKLRTTCDEKVKRYEDENRMLAMALEEANSKNFDQEQKLISLQGEVEGLKGHLSSTQKQSSKTPKSSTLSKELKQRDDMLDNVEERNIKLEDQLKWKKEQFCHLEEAHQKLRSELKTKEKEWAKERNELFDEISTLQSNLDSQIRISQGLENRMQQCNQALAHEESKRKYFEVQLLESRTCLANVMAENEEATSKIETLTGRRDEEIASLRHLLGKKETHHKEMDYQLRRLEEEKKDLILSLKEFQESGIKEAGSASSLSKLRNKLRALEQVHKDCSTNVRAKEVEWRIQSEKLMEDLNLYKSELQEKNISIEELKLRLDQVHKECASILEENEAKWCSQLDSLMEDLGFCRSELEIRNITVEDLKREVEACDSLIFQLALQNEETSLMLLVLRSELSEAQHKLAEDYANMDQKNKDSINLLSDHLEMKNSALMKAQMDIEEEREKVACLARKVESLNIVESQQHSSEIALSRQKELLDESYASQAHLEEQLFSMKKDLNNVHDALDIANEELAEKLCEANGAEFELQIWKSIAEQLKSSLEDNRKMRIEVEDSLLADTEFELNLKQEKECLEHVIEEKDETISCLKEQLIKLKEDLKTKNEEYICHNEAEKAKSKSMTDNLQNEIEWIEQEWLKKELEGAILAQVDAERYYEEEKESLHHLVEEREQRIGHLQQLVRSLECEFESSTGSFGSKLSDMQVEISLFRKAWEKMATVEILKEIEIQASNLVIAELENELSSLVEKVTSLKKALSNSEVTRAKLEGELEVKQMELKDVKSTSNIDTLYEGICMLAKEDKKLMESLTSMLMIEVEVPIKENAD
ncbi:hypothetical protein Leryth_012781, partial [Lithospermum erythrorhizon]